MRLGISSLSVELFRCWGLLSVGLLSGFRLQSSTESLPVSSRVMSSKLASFSLLALSSDSERHDEELLLELLL